MLTHLLDLLAYSALSASLVAQTMIAPDAAVVFTPDVNQLFTEETVELTVTLKANTPIASITGMAIYDPAVLTLETTSAADNFYISLEESDTPGTIPFSVHTDTPGATVGIHHALTFTFTTVHPGTTTLQIENVQTLTPEDNAINTIDLATTTIQILTRRNGLDLNADNVYTLADLRLFVTYLATQNPSADFNNDGRVSREDFRILLRMY